MDYINGRTGLEKQLGMESKILVMAVKRKEHLIAEDRVTIETRFNVSSDKRIEISKNNSQ